VRARLQSIRSNEEGYTLLEVLVVVLIIGVLAAIAIPSFLNQTTKATDASAKELAHSALIAAESYATDHNGSYAGLSVATLAQYDATIQTDPSAGGAYVSSVGSPTGSGYAITATSANHVDTFTLTRLNGTISRTCAPANGVHGGCSNGTW
jgi:type IV pilus assembly protein PilA